MAPKKLLVVEDDQLIRTVVEDGLKDLGLQLSFAASGTEGLEIFQQQRPDALLVDVLLPKMSGFELCQTIRQQLAGGEVPVILMSAVYKSLSVQNEAKTKYGATDFLTKPLNINLLRDRLEALLHTGTPVPVAEQPDLETDVTGPTAGIPAGTKTLGDLAAVPFASVFVQIHQQGRTGALYVTKGKVKKTIYFIDGAPVAVQSNLLSETLARILQSQGRFTQDQLEDTRLIAKQRNKLHGQALIDLGLLKPDELEQALDFQHHEKILNIFSWTSGGYEFDRGMKPPKATVLVKTDIPAVMLQGAVERMSFEIIKQQMGPAADNLVGWTEEAPYPLAAFRLGAEERAMLSTLDGTKTLKRLLQGVHQPDYLLRLVYILSLAGNLRLADVLDQADVHFSRKMQAELSAAMDVKQAPKAEEELSLAELIANKYTILESADYFQLLEITSNASVKTVRESYLRLSKIFHPEKVRQTMDPSSMDKVQAIYARLTTAYEVLSDEDDRDAYLTEMKNAAK